MSEQPRLRIVNLGGSVYGIEDERGRLGQVRRNFGGTWTAYRDNPGGYLGPLGGPYDHMSRKAAIAHLRDHTRPALSQPGGSDAE